MERAAWRMAVSSVPTRIGVPSAEACADPAANPASTASTTSGSASPRSVCCSGAYRTSAYTTPSAARSSAHSAATRCSASAVWVTATVWANVARYRSSEPECAACTNHRPRPSASVAGSG